MESDRSLGSGLSIPQWMKTKMIDNRLDLDQGAFSPPNHDESFLYIRYPRKSRDEGRRPSAEKNFIAATAETPDLSKHPEPCRPFITGVGSTVTGKQLKSNGTDDGFKGKAAACGTSIVKVAHQMVSEQRQQYDPQSVQTNGVDFPQGFNASIRRGSRSLPASPLASPSSSPKVYRKLLTHNKYFTAAFTDGEKNGSWILAGLLGKRDPLSKSVTTVAEETMASMTDLSLSTDEDLQSKKSLKQVFRAKPSELREMNFWSPTSM